MFGITKLFPNTIIVDTGHSLAQCFNQTLLLFFIEHSSINGGVKLLGNGYFPLTQLLLVWSRQFYWWSFGLQVNLRKRSLRINLAPTSTQRA